MEKFFKEEGDQGFRQYLKNNNIENKSVETIATKCELVITNEIIQFYKIQRSLEKEIGSLEKEIGSLEKQILTSTNKKDNEISNLSKKISELTFENYKIKQNLQKQIQIVDISSYSSSYSDYYFNKEKLQLVKNDVSFWSPFTTPNNELFKEFEEKIKYISNLTIEKEIHSKLVPLIKNIMERMGSKMEFIDTHDKATISGMFKPDWTVYTEKNKKDYFFCAGIGDTKKGNHFKIKHFGQIFKYMDLICIGCGLKTEINGFLINNSQICFIKGKKKLDQSKLNYEITKPYDFNEGLIYLFNFFQNSKEQTKLPFSLEEHMKKENCINTLEFENQGKSSSIFSVEYGNQIKIIKLFHRIEEKETEYNTIMDLGKTIKESIPTITNHNTEWIEMIPLGNLVDKKAPRSLFVKLTNLLKKVHTLGYIHRDIRPSNIIVYKNEPYLIDWGFAIKNNSEEIYQGTLMTASDRILDLLIDPSVKKFSLKPSDDLVSLVKTIIVLKETGVEEDIRSANLSLQQLKEYWKSVEKTSLIYKKLLDMALKCDYQSIIKFLE
ncbi:hypothetical protein ACTFIZ_011095 [Dictyostelium cf. discoideum]